MRTCMIGLLLIVLVPVLASTQAPNQGKGSATFVMDEEVKKVVQGIKDKKGTTALDQTLKVVDIGGKYNVALGVVHRGKTTTKPGAPVSGIVHDDTTEVYIIISGGGTMITGGTLTNPTRLAADSVPVRDLNGPTTTGPATGYESRQVKVGDIIVIPEGVVHGFSEIPDHITYVSPRPDPKRVLKAGYVHPLIAAK